MCLTGLGAGAIVLAQRLDRHNGLLGKTIQHGRRYGTELSDYAKMAGMKGIIHSDEKLSKYGVSEAEEKALHKKLEISEWDAFVLVVAPKISSPSA